jgi:hypothetical protein
MRITKPRGFWCLRPRPSTWRDLEGSQDTEFKSKFFQLLEEAYSAGRVAGDIELFAETPDVMRFRILIQEAAWKNDLEGVMT